MALPDMERTKTMPCDTRTLTGQTLSQRKQEVRDALARLSIALIKRQVRPVIDRATGAITFAGWTEQARGRVSDACAYRMLMVTGSALARAEIARAEQMAGRGVSKQAVAAGAHSHDGGGSWHHGH
jgi:hypothetical protein